MKNGKIQAINVRAEEDEAPVPKNSGTAFDLAGGHGTSIPSSFSAQNDKTHAAPSAFMNVPSALASTGPPAPFGSTASAFATGTVSAFGVGGAAPPAIGFSFGTNSAFGGAAQPVGTQSAFGPPFAAPILAPTQSAFDLANVPAFSFGAFPPSTAAPVKPAFGGQASLGQNSEGAHADSSFLMCELTKTDLGEKNITVAKLQDKLLHTPSATVEAMQTIMLSR